MSRPWERGQHPTHTAFDIVVNVCQSSEGAVYTQHFLAEEDSKWASALRSGGEEQIAFALLCEAVRREAFLETLIEGGKDENYIRRYGEGDEEVRAKMEKELEQRILSHMLRTVHRLAADKAKEVLKIISREKGYKTG